MEGKKLVTNRSWFERKGNERKINSTRYFYKKKFK